MVTITDLTFAGKNGVARGRMQIKKLPAMAYPQRQRSLLRQSASAGEGPRNTIGASVVMFSCPKRN
jgi:hypothetical protein